MLHVSLGIYMDVVYVIAQQSLIIFHVVIVVIFISSIVAEVLVEPPRDVVLSLIELKTNYFELIDLQNLTCKNYFKNYSCIYKKYFISEDIIKDNL